MFNRLFSVFLILGLLAAGCGAVNRSVSIPDGTELDDNVTNINGSITIGRDCRINGKIRNVNGQVRISENARVGQVSNTNGSISIASGARTGAIGNTNGRIRLADSIRVEGGVVSTNGPVETGAEVHVDGDIQTANGRIRTGTGSVITGEVETTNGSIELVGTEAAGVSGANGSIELLDGTRIAGDVYVRRPSGSNSSSRLPRVVIGADTVVEGTLQFERDVELYIHETARTGQVIGAEPIRFSGDSP